VLADIGSKAVFALGEHILNTQDNVFNHHVTFLKLIVPVSIVASNTVLKAFPYSIAFDLFI